MYRKKTPFSAIGFIFSNGFSFYNYYTDGTVNFIRFDEDVSPDTRLRNMKKILYIFYFCSGVWINTLSQFPFYSLLISNVIPDIVGYIIYVPVDYHY